MPDSSEKEKELKSLVKKLDGGILSSAGKRCEAARSLERLGGPDAVSYLIEAFGKEKDEKVRRCIIQSLGGIGDPDATSFLFEMIFEVPADWKKLVLTSLEKCVHEQNIPFFIDKLASNNLQKKKLAISYLGKLGNPVAIPSLIELLNEPEDIRNLAYASLKVFRPEDMVPCVAAEIQEADRYFQIRLIMLLSGMKSTLAVPVLLKMLQSTDVSVRSSAAKTLSECVDRSSAVILEEALDDENPNVRCAAVKELISLGSEIPAPKLLSFLEDENEHVRSCAVETLGKTGDLSTIPALERVMLEDEDDWVRKLAGNSILKIKENEIKEPASTNNDEKETVDIVIGDEKEIEKEGKNLQSDDSSSCTFSFCPYCGNRLDLPETPLFCPYCGHKLAE